MRQQDTIHKNPLINLGNVSLRTKLVAIQVFTSLVVLTIFFVVYVMSDIKEYKQRKVASVMGLAQVIGANSVSSLDFQDEDEAKKLLVELRKVSPEVIYAAILDNDNKIFASYASQKADSNAFPVKANGDGFDFARNHLFIKKQIIDGGRAMGYVTLEVELTELELIKRSKYQLAYILLIASVGLSLLVGFIIQPYISKRLLLLVGRMKEVSITGNYSATIKDRGTDEISTLFKVFNEMMEKIRESEKKKDDFIGIASHELKTPLTSIKGYLELLHELEDREPNKQFVKKARENVDKLQQLVKDLLDVSKIQSGQLELNMVEFSMDKLINEMIDSYQVLSESHKLIGESNEPVFVYGDRQKIEQVLVNLLSNAIKYSPGQHQVIISSVKKGSELCVRIRDFGIGIPKEEHDKIFNRFYRPKETSAHISGFGLGLYICNDIIRRHKGRIWVETEEKGTSFYFSLPLIEEVSQVGVMKHN